MKRWAIVCVLTGSVILLALFIFSNTDLADSIFPGSLRSWQPAALWLWEKIVPAVQWLLWGLALIGLGDLCGWKVMCHRGWFIGAGLQLAVGYAVLAGANFTLGVVGAVTHWTVLIAPVVGLGWALWRLLRWWMDRGKGQHEHGVKVSEPISLWEALLAAGVGLLVLWHIMLSFLPETNWDSLVYHLYLPKLWLHDGYLTAPLWNDYARMPLLMSLIYTSGLALPLGEVGARGASLWAGLGGILLAGGIARQGLGRGAAWLVMLLIIAEPMIFGQMAATGSDVPALLFLFGAWALLFPPEGRKANPLLGGILAGCLIGCKLVAVYGALALGILLIYQWIRREDRALKNLVLYIAGTIAAFLPWMIKALVLTGNPFYPFAPGILGSGDMPTEVAQKLTAWLGAMGMGRGSTDYLVLLPRIFFAAGPGYWHFDGMVNPAHLLLIPVAIFLLPRDRTTRFALAAAALVFIFWAIGPQQIRFLTPALALMALAWGRMSEVFGGISRWIVRSIAFLGVTFSIVLVLPSVSDTFPALTGETDSRTYLNSEVDILDACDWMDANLPADAKVLLVFYNRGYMVPRPVLAESYFEASRLGWEAEQHGAAGLAQWLVENGYGYVMTYKNPYHQQIILGYMDDAERAGVLQFLKLNVTALYEDKNAVVGKING
jgi:hypothetical protein